MLSGRNDSPLCSSDGSFRLLIVLTPPAGLKASLQRSEQRSQQVTTSHIRSHTQPRNSVLKLMKHSTEADAFCQWDITANKHTYKYKNMKLHKIPRCAKRPFYVSRKSGDRESWQLFLCRAKENEKTTPQLLETQQTEKNGVIVCLKKNNTARAMGGKERKKKLGSIENCN